MKGRTRERWMELCEQAVNEQNPARFMKLMKEINELLEAKAARVSLDEPQEPKKPGTSNEN